MFENLGSEWEQNSHHTVCSPKDEFPFPVNRVSMNWIELLQELCEFVKLNVRCLFIALKDESTTLGVCLKNIINGPG